MVPPPPRPHEQPSTCNRWVRYCGCVLNLACAAQMKHIEPRGIALHPLPLNSSSRYWSPLQVGDALEDAASLLDLMSEYPLLEKVRREQLRRARKALGAEHPDVGTSLNNMGALLKAMGRLEDAEPLYRESLEIRRKALGAEHPDVKKSMMRLEMIRKKLNAA